MNYIVRKEEAAYLLTRFAEYFMSHTIQNEQADVHSFQVGHLNVQNEHYLGSSDRNSWQITSRTRGVGLLLRGVRAKNGMERQCILKTPLTALDFPADWAGWEELWGGSNALITTRVFIPLTAAVATTPTWDHQWRTIYLISGSRPSLPSPIRYG